MSLARKILSNTAWQVIGKVITAGLGIISVKLITNYLSPEIYGEYTTIYDYTALFAIVADFGLFTIAVREMAGGGGDTKVVSKIVSNVLSIRTFLAGASLALGAGAAFLIPAYDNSFIPLGVVLVSCATILTLIAGTISSVLQFYLKMHWASIALTLGKVVTVAYIITVIVYLFPSNPEAGFRHLFFAWIAGSLLSVIITFIASSRLVPIRYEFDFVFWKTVLIKALPYGLALVLGTIYFRMGTIVMSLFKLKEQIGFFGVPMRFLEILQIIPHFFMNSVLPTLTMAVAASNPARTSKIVRYALNGILALGVPTLVGGYVLAWPITAAVSSPEFLTRRLADGTVMFGSDLALKILLIAVVFTYLHVVLSYTLVAMHRQSELLWINGIVVIINITLNVILAPRYGFIGAAVTAVISECIVLIALFSRVRLRIGNIWDLGFIGKTAFSALLMGVMLHFLLTPLHDKFQSLSLLILIPLGGVVFGGSMLATKALDKEMIAMLRRR
ncbi:hypothetical protein COV82_05320 [Candidatus Peregrinibacteria bacterium CG11_big_fil_rev_8_21_14_0_20_46_8]|nr:MAG: hypothetical protein COV82_05320 [Candidatus Peregrinibacteria bacterium CG11_big_fil_rev_8_21_14_0_20_46_8]